MRAATSVAGLQLDYRPEGLSASRGRVALLRSELCREDGPDLPPGVAGGHWNCEHGVQVFDWRRPALALWDAQAGVSSFRRPPTFALSPDGDALTIGSAAGQAQNHGFSSSCHVAATITVERWRADGYSRTEALQVPRHLVHASLHQLPPLCWTADGHAIALSGVSWPQDTGAEALDPYTRKDARYWAQLWHVT